MRLSIDKVFEQLPGTYICWKDSNSRFLGCNEAFAHLIGKSKEEIIGSIDQLEKHVRDDQAVRSSGKPKMGMIETIPDREGKMIQIKTNKAPLLDYDGSICGTIVDFVKL